MPKFVVDIWLDGYSEDDSSKYISACQEFIEEQLNFSASDIMVVHLPDDATDDEILELCRK